MKHNINKKTFSFSILLSTILLLVVAISYAQQKTKPKDFGVFYDRLAHDLRAGRPLVATVYVALCDNDSQGIAPVRNRKICMGDVPEKNLYWATDGGLKGHLRSQRWKKVLYETAPNENLAARGVWKKRLPIGGALRARGVKGRIDVYIVGLAYRGIRIETALLDYLNAVERDDSEELSLTDGTVLEIGGKSHLLGYIGHDYFMDAPTVGDAVKKRSNMTNALTKGVFALSCISDEYFRPSIQRPHTHILALNRSFTYPSAFTAVGIVRGVAAGKKIKGVHREAARAFAKGQNKSIGTMLRALSYGDK